LVELTGRVRDKHMAVRVIITGLEAATAQVKAEKTS
jgi:hypothetical protein